VACARALVAPDPVNARVVDLTRRANGRQDDWELIEACTGVPTRRVAFRAGPRMQSRVAEEGGAAGELPMLHVFAQLERAAGHRIDPCAEGTPGFAEHWALRR